MENKNLVGTIVVHKSFGEGIVKSVYDKYLEVFFPGRDKNSKFMYPSCFYNFLKLENEEIQAEVLKDLETWKSESGIAHKEELKLLYEKRQRDIKARQMAAEEKKQRAAQRTMRLRNKYNQGNKEG